MTLVGVVMYFTPQDVLQLTILEATAYLTAHNELFSSSKSSGGFPNKSVGAMMHRKAQSRGYVD